MTDTIQIQIDRADGSLQRLIGLVERRGFHIDGMSRGRDEGRCTENLGRQIDKLIGATRVGFAGSTFGYQSVAAA